MPVTANWEQKSPKMESQSCSAAESSATHKLAAPQQSMGSCVWQKQLRRIRTFFWTMRSSHTLADHKNSVHETFDTKHGMRWRLLIKECNAPMHAVILDLRKTSSHLVSLQHTHPMLTPVLSTQMRMISLWPPCPLLHKQITQEQDEGNPLQVHAQDASSGHKVEPIKHSSRSCDIIVNKDA